MKLQINLQKKEQLKNVKYLKIPYTDLREEYQKESKKRSMEQNSRESTWKKKRYFETFFQKRTKFYMV